MAPDSEFMLGELGICVCRGGSRRDSSNPGPAPCAEEGVCIGADPTYDTLGRGGGCIWG